MELKNKDLKRRIIEISYKNKLSHLGSCLTAVDIIAEIFKVKKPDEKFVLSSGHAGLALYVVIEKYSQVVRATDYLMIRAGWNEQNFFDAEKIFEHHGVHPDYCEECHIDCSSGSLGMGAGIATGIALANRDRLCYALLSDGEMQEGSCYEALEVAHQQKLSNLRIYINCNNWGAYQRLEKDHIIDRCRAFTNVNITFRSTNMEEWPEFLQGQQAHYHTLNEEEYNLCKEILRDSL